ncbi:response regulator transcription factor [Paraburkholderia sp. LEh10]|uniref:response regulator transcription factor n=1 Tax=Paraburkholderia sp. LEh10 TaxID=2821353 RepID=UPI001AE8EB52|nr:response regulator [Paraburkholderia sp. LEh10]MBP0589548.1 response regulator transcription factor [Paraburkholderia sp. LEh10]
MTTTGKSTSGDGDGSLTPSIVYIIDDDEDVRESLGSLLRSVGHRVEAFSSPVEFIAFRRENIPSCLILDVRLRSESGLAFQQSIANLAPHIPILFITGFPDVEMSVKAMKAGAMDFFSKPFREQDMLDAVTQALRRDAERLAFESSIAELRGRYESLTPKERDVLEYVLAGLLNKQIADEMHLSEITIKLHRGQVMRKMGARSVVELVRHAQVLGVNPRARRT